MAVDHMPMLSGSAAHRYGCRQKNCGLIPKSETGWFLARQPNGQGSAGKCYWFCPACGGQSTYNPKGTGDGAQDIHRQDKPYQYVPLFAMPC